LVNKYIDICISAKKERKKVDENLKSMNFVHFYKDLYKFFFNLCMFLRCHQQTKNNLHFEFTFWILAASDL